MSTPVNKLFDVVILGSGIAGSILGTLLARHGAQVLLLDRSKHPRFAIGESTVPHTSMMLRILSDRFDVPELANYAAFEGLQSKIKAKCGIKRNFGFVYHREGQPQNPLETTQSVIPEFPDGPESHLFRQEIDLRLHDLAIGYGVTSLEEVGIAEIDFDDQKVSLRAEDGRCFEARFLVDATGFRSPLAEKLKLRERPTPLRTHSRAIFTHMRGVRPFDDCVESHDMPRQWFQGTLHHLFDGGWMWVIPFDNHEDSSNPLCSVGVNLDPRRFPKNGLDGADEFAEVVGRFPALAAQFEEAEPVRDWISTHRLQYSSHTSVGDRFCLMAHAAGTIDALFSRGLANTMDVINALVPSLLEGLAEDDLSRDRFLHVEKLQQRVLDYNDRLVASSYIAFRDFELWNAWYRIWVLGAFYGWLRLNRIHKTFQESGDPKVFDRLQQPRWEGSLAVELDGFENLFNQSCDELEAVEKGSRSAAEATTNLYRMIRESAIIPPLFRLEDPEQRATVEFGQAEFFKLMYWFRRKAPEEVQRLFLG